MDEKHDETMYKIPTEKDDLIVTEIVQLSTFNPVGNTQEFVVDKIAISSEGNHVIIDFNSEIKKRIILRRKTDKETGYKPNCSGLFFGIMKAINRTEKGRKLLDEKAGYILDSDLLEIFWEITGESFVILELNHTETTDGKSRRFWNVKWV
jgi:hypothetical protein